MATKARLTTRGFEKPLERIVELGKDIDVIVDQALQAGAEVRQKGMRERVLKDKHNLERHISIKGPDQTGNYHFVEIGVINEKAYTDAETARYANAQEFGWGNHLEGQSWRPYIRPTRDEDMPKARRAMKQVFDRGDRAMSTIWEITATALSGLSVPMAASYDITATGAQLPDEFIVYTLITSPPELHADNEEELRSYRMQVSIYNRAGLADLPAIDSAMVAAGFTRGPQRELPYNQKTRHFGLALDYILP